MFGAGAMSVRSPAIRCRSDSCQASWVVRIAVIASLRQHQASSSCPSLAWALAKHDKFHGSRNFAPADRAAVMLDVIIGIATEASPVSANRQPWIAAPAALQYSPCFSSAIAISSWACAAAAA